MVNRNGNGIMCYLEKIQNLVESLNKRNQSFGEINNLIAYRGEAEDYGVTKLKPSIFRDSKHLKNEKKLFELLYDYGIIDSSVNKNIEKAIESQHYLAISRLLDITFNALSALFFACNYSQENNGYIYIFCFPEYYSPNSKFIEEFYTRVLSEGNQCIPYSKNFKVISHSHGNERMRAQDGGFIFFPGNEFKSINEIYYEKLEIKHSDKKKILADLSLIFNINEPKLYPEKDKFSTYIKEKLNQDYKMDMEITSTKELEKCICSLQFEIGILISSGNYNKNQL
ncbi:FRG domain-containing protein, partial [Listeria monocytogenes]|nr:FRG domain-containing protein [Listeria monocytogenes]